MDLISLEGEYDLFVITTDTPWRFAHHTDFLTHLCPSCISISCSHLAPFSPCFHSSFPLTGKVSLLCFASIAPAPRRCIATRYCRHRFADPRAHYLCTPHALFTSLALPFVDFFSLVEFLRTKGIRVREEWCCSKGDGRGRAGYWRTEEHTLLFAGRRLLEFQALVCLASPPFLTRLCPVAWSLVQHIMFLCSHELLLYETIFLRYKCARGRIANRAGRELPDSWLIGSL